MSQPFDASLVGMVKRLLCSISGHIGGDDNLGLHFCAERVISNGLLDTVGSITAVSDAIKLFSFLNDFVPEGAPIRAAHKMVCRVLSEDVKINLYLLIKLGAPSDVSEVWAWIGTMLLESMSELEISRVKHAAESWKYTVTF